MDSPSMSWLSELGLDSSLFMDQSDFLDPFDEEVVDVIRHDFENCLSGENNSPSSPTLPNIPSTNSITSVCTSPRRSESPQLGADHQPPFNNFSNFVAISDPDRASSAPIILNFGNAKSPENLRRGRPKRPRLNPDDEAAIVEVLRSEGGDFEEQPNRAQPAKKPSRVRPPSQTYDHIIAERKRREQLSQLFMALSTMVPGLKKMDKTSVLGDAIKYLKQLQEKVKVLEEESTKKKMESAIFVKKSQVTEEDDVSSDENSGNSDEQPLPEIEARVCNCQLLIRVHCEKERGLLVNLFNEVEKLDLSVVNTSVASFGTVALDITITTEVEEGFNLTLAQVVKRLRAALQPTV